MELPPGVLRRPGADVDALADGPSVVVGTDEGTIEPRGRAFEMIASRHGVVRVEHVAELAGDAGELVDGDTPFRTIDQETQDRPSAFGAIVDVDELEPRRSHQGLRERPDARADRRPIHTNAVPPNEKVGRGPLDETGQ